MYRRLMLLNRVTLANFYRDDSFWESMCDMIALENLLYCPRRPQSRTWKETYGYLLSIKSTFRAEPSRCETTCKEGCDGGVVARPKTRSCFNIKVFTRVRPAPNKPCEETPELHAVTNNMARRSLPRVGGVQ